VHPLTDQAHLQKKQQQKRQVKTDQQVADVAQEGMP
jgi:hypothetical protein